MPVQAIPTPPKRLRILGAEEIDALYGRPRFTPEEVYIFRELWHFLTTQRLVAPGYTVLQELIGQALTAEQQRLITVVRTHLQPTGITAFQRLLEDAPGLYAITCSDLIPSRRRLDNSAPF